MGRDQFNHVAVSFDRNFVLGGTDSGIRRYDLTGSLVDIYNLEGGVSDLEGCVSQSRLGLTAGTGRLYLNDDVSGAPAGWRIPDDRFAKSKGDSSISFDRDCNAYQGLWNGYRIYRYPDGPVEPNTSKPPKHQIHPAGYHATNIHRGIATVNDILAWPQGPVVVGSSRGVWGANSHRNAYRQPYWKTFNVGITRSTIARRFALSPTTGHAFLATSAAAQVPRYCRKNVARRRARRCRRSRHTRNYFYVFCGYAHKLWWALSSSGPLVNGRTFGRGGTAFNPLNALKVGYDRNAGGLVDVREQDKNHMWLPDTASSTVLRVSTANFNPDVVSAYRVGLPGGECPGTCCWDNGCNMASRVAVDSRGDALCCDACVRDAGYRYKDYEIALTV